MHVINIKKKDLENIKEDAYIIIYNNQVIRSNLKISHYEDINNEDGSVSYGETHKVLLDT